jgi:hypothetical protein
VNQPSPAAATARSWLASANRSISARPIPHFAAIMSAARNWEISCSPYLARQPSDPENGPANPNACPASIAAAMGIMLMFCTPPASTRSAVPLSTAWAAKWTACWDEPHCRSTVTPGTASGSPAASHAVRAMSPACGPIVSTQPNTTSSTASGSTPVRSSSARMTCAPRSAGWAPARPPPRRPTGVRTASTRYASATRAPLSYTF